MEDRTSINDGNCKTFPMEWAAMEFTRFLKERHAFGGFLTERLKANIDNMAQQHPLEGRNKYIEYYELFQLVSRAFRWMATKEGPIFYLNLHKDWRKYIEEKMRHFEGNGEK